MTLCRGTGCNAPIAGNHRLEWAYEESDGWRAGDVIYVDAHCTAGHRAEIEVIFELRHAVERFQLLEPVPLVRQAPGVRVVKRRPKSGGSK